jgi:hypothetical protein
MWRVTKEVLILTNIAVWQIVWIDSIQMILSTLGMKMVLGCLVHLLSQCFFFFFRGQFCDVAKVVIISIHWLEDLAKFGYKLNLKVEI